MFGRSLLSPFLEDLGGQGPAADLALAEEFCFLAGASPVNGGERASRLSWRRGSSGRHLVFRSRCGRGAMVKGLIVSHLLTGVIQHVYIHSLICTTRHVKVPFERPLSAYLSRSSLARVSEI